MQVSIDRCSFRGTEQAIARARESLEKSRFPSVGDSEYVIIRQLNLAVEPSEMERSVFRKTDSLLAARVSGWSDDAATADCVWFASESDLYACLCRDIALGRVDGLWFWKQFAHLDTGRAATTIARILIRQSPAFPAMLMQLADSGNLLQVWRQLGAEEKQLLLQQAVPAHLRTAIETATREADFPVADSPAVSPLPSLLSMLLEALPRDADAASPGVQLAIALFVMASRPHLAVSPVREPAIRELVEAVATSGLLRTASVTLQAGPAEAMPSPDIRATGMKPAAPSDSAEQKRETIDASRPVEESPDEQVALTETVAGEPAEAFQAQEQPLEIPENRPSGPAEMEQIPAAVDDTAADSAITDHWHVGQGGLFYLLNVLNQPVIRDLLLNDPRAVAFPSGWSWLYRFGEALGLEYECELVRCLARLSGMEEKAFLENMPQLEAAREILDYASRRYLGFGIWDVSLLKKPAHIAFLQPEVTVSFRMDAIDIQLRKSGLDIDPGWIDWLGSIIRFRYREFL